MSDRPAINEHVSRHESLPSTGTREKNGGAPPTVKTNHENHQNGLPRGSNQEIYLADLRNDEG
ncbi:hypothetical protein F2Q69_00019906 [Brassica cretica]|uniref:Uncharacterized protein n=1 Tax=Brassica cretica TaxID=69181 RepID=A0A8S9QAR3_BRACR|nr:hypothetical protein F2Q69_00019906 [Brassica cretica]